MCGLWPMSDGFLKRTETEMLGIGESERERNGFTLIEVLIAITILTVIMMVVYQAFTASTDGIRRAEAVDELNSMARVVFIRLVDDINGACLSLCGKDDNVSFVGEARRDKGLPQDSLKFTTLTNEIIVKDAKESDLHEVGYKLKKNDGTNQGSRIEGKEVFSLYRKEKKAIRVEPPVEGTEYLLTDEIAGLRFSYFDGSWKDNWDSRSTLPKAVEVEIIFFDAEKRERSFRTIIDVPMGSK